MPESNRSALFYLVTYEITDTVIFAVMNMEIEKINEMLRSCREAFLSLFG